MGLEPRGGAALGPRVSLGVLAGSWDGASAENGVETNLTEHSPTPASALLSPAQSGLVHCAQEAAFARSSQLPSYSDLQKPTPLSCRPSLVPSYSYV